MHPLSIREQKHRVLIYVTCYNVLDGVTLTIRKIEQEILAQGHSVCILTTTSGNILNTNIHMGGESKQNQKYRHLPHKHPNRTVIFIDNSIPIPFMKNPSNPENSYRLGFSLSNDVKKKLDKFEPTVIHVTVPDVTCLHLIEYARTSQLPLMGTYHSNIPDYFTHYPGIGWMKYIVAAYVRHQYNFIQGLYVPTPFIQRHLTVEEHYQFDKVTNLDVWGRGVDLDRFHPSQRCERFRERHGFTPDDVVVTWVGRVVPEKRPDIFAYVVRRLAKEGIPFKALIVGAGPCEDELKVLPNTTFAGWMSGDELAVAYASSDIFLFPSAVETFGNVTLEAAASGLPLVVDSGCSGHLVQHGMNGFVCSDGDKESYYKRTSCLVLDNLRRRSMSIEGRKLSLRFENRSVCRRMIDNYSTITNEFYDVYNGDHNNRDREYEAKNGSFTGGCYVRPTSLVVVEYLFIIIFRTVYGVTELFANIEECIVSSRRSATSYRTSPAHTATTIKSSSSFSIDSPVVIPEAIDSSNDDTVVPSTKTTDREETMTLESMSELDHYINDSVAYDSNQKVRSILSQSSHKKEVDDNLITMIKSDDDDDTASTDSSIYSCDNATSSSSCSLSTRSSHRRRVDRIWQFEMPISHNIAILIVKFVRAQGRIESRIRNFCSRNIHASSTIKNCHVVSCDRNRKRKDSEEIIPDDCDDTNMVSMQLNELLLSSYYCCDCVESSIGGGSFTMEEIDLPNART